MSQLTLLVLACISAATSKYLPFCILSEGRKKKKFSSKFLKNVFSIVVTRARRFRIAFRDSGY